MAILNQRDYRSARSRLAQLTGALSDEAVVEDLLSAFSAEISSVRRKALKSEAEALRQELDKYDQLQSAGGISAEFPTNDLGLLPIVARIARRLSQRELADRIGISEQQIQRYESDRYSGIGLSRYSRVLDVLGVTICPKLAAQWDTLESAQKVVKTSYEFDPLVISELRKRNWLSLPRGTAKEDVQRILDNYIAESSGLTRTGSLYRRQIRGTEGVDKRVDNGALAIWQTRVIREATTHRQNLRSKFNIVDVNWVANLARISARSDGPALVAAHLRAQGIIFVIVPHLPHTLLDGAAMLLSDGTPIIALTLRYDRLDSFWFTLFHEIGHVLLHFYAGLEEGFIDDMDVIESSDREREADLFAFTALIPDGIWNAAPARFSNSSEAVRKMASSLGIHPAIVAGRIRRERGDYRLFNDLVGTGLVRRILNGSPAA